MDMLQGDAGLLAAIRGGNAAAYVGLYERHVAAARALARQLVHTPAEVEDVVAETFTRLLDLIRRDGGPRESFRPYLLTALRRTLYERGRNEGGHGAGTEIELFDPGVPFVDPALTGLERSLVARAFLSLPERWQLVLWHTEVERASPAEIAILLGLPQDAVAAFACQALEGLRQACLRAHLAGAPRHGCRSVLAKMGAYVRGGLAKRESRSVDRHVADCADCRVVFMELNDVSQGLRVIVGPLIAGPTLSGYLTALGRNDRGGGLLGGVIGWGREPGRWQQIAATVGAAVALTVAVALVVTAMGDPALFSPAHTSTPIPAPIVAQPGPDAPSPSDVPSLPDGTPSPGDPGSSREGTPDPHRSVVVVPPFGRPSEPAPVPGRTPPRSAPGRPDRHARRAGQVRAGHGGRTAAQRRHGPEREARGARHLPGRGDAAPHGGTEPDDLRRRPRRAGRSGRGDRLRRWKDGDRHEHGGRCEHGGRAGLGGCGA
nr:hypothetical protein GCM10020093_079670 [Planobispora longispora]